MAKNSTIHKQFSDTLEFSTRADERLSEDAFDIYLIRIIESLSNAINFEFTKGKNSEEVFTMPAISGLDNLQKAQLARDLSELLHNLRNFRESINFRDSVESIRNFKVINILKSRDIIESLMNSNEMYLSKTESEEILNLIFIHCSESKS